MLGRLSRGHTQRDKENDLSGYDAARVCLPFSGVTDLVSGLVTKKVKKINNLYLKRINPFPAVFFF